MINLHTADTAQLVEQARGADVPLHRQQAAFTELVLRAQQVVFGIALAALRDVDEAKDAAQDAFAMAWRRLRQLRDPSAFEPWVKAMVVRACWRRRRARRPVAEPEPPLAASDLAHLDYEAIVSTQLARLPEGERQVMVLYYFLGYTQPQIATLLGLKPGTVGKRLHSARLRIRGCLSPSLRRDFVRTTPSPAFAERVRRGLLDDYTGHYRFDERPDHVVSIVREGDALISEGSGQRHLLVPGGEHSLLASAYDGEGRFYRDRRGRVTHLVYYEFGRRMGTARRIDAPV